jgi:hypothetical protein
MLPSAQCRSTNDKLLTNSSRHHPLSDEDADAIYVDDNTRIQILDTMLDLPRADKEQCGAFIVRWSFLNLVVHLCVIPTIQRDERVLVVWSDNMDSIIPQCRDFDGHLIKLVWAQRQSLMGITPGPSIAGTPGATSEVPSVANSASDVQLNEEKALEQEAEHAPVSAPAKPISGGSLWGWRIGSKAKQAPAPRDLEQGGASARPTRYFAPVYGGLGLALSTCAVFIYRTFLGADQYLQVFIFSGVNILLQEWRLTHSYIRFALMATTPLLFCVSLVSSYSTSFPCTV